MPILSLACKHTRHIQGFVLDTEPAVSYVGQRHSLKGVKTSNDILKSTHESEDLIENLDQQTPK